MTESMSGGSPYSSAFFATSGYRNFVIDISNRWNIVLSQ